MNGAMVVLAPHPDDEILGAGGIMARAHAGGNRVGVIVLTDGGRSDPAGCSMTMKARRAMECRLGLAALLGEVPPLMMLKCPDGELDSRYPDLADTSALGRFLRDLAPVTVLVTDPDDNHPDHKAAFGLACRIVGMGMAQQLYVLPVSQRVDATFSRRGYETILVGEYVAAKRDAIRNHQSQITASRTGFALSKAAQESFATVEYTRPVVNSQANALQPQVVAPSHFDEMFARNSDPWNYQTDPYEAARFARTLSALEDRWYPEAIELGCANGILTTLLASQSGHLIAIDASREALAVAKVRLGAVHNVELRLGHLPQDFPHGSFDLIVLSDFLYYLGFDGCIALAAKISGSAAPGCRIVIANYLGETECALTGEMAAELMIAHLPDWTLAYQDRCDRLRIDVLDFA